LFNSKRFGLNTIYDIPKPSYRAFELLSRIGSEDYLVLYQEAGANDTAVDLTAVSSETDLILLLSNFDVPAKAPSGEDVCIRIDLSAVTTGPKNITGILYQIDETHSNPAALWRQMGSPQYPTAAQIQELKEASELQAQLFQAPVDEKGICTIEIHVPSYGVAFIDFSGVSQ
jgi:xylan 1,4-beta-xylosidase